ncbi:MAG: low molecular weight protein-tyrosine-phosphatase [Acidobacteriota bacterium]|nr:low molecular weight protein-tyrosine-phosphatase [Acidobacteriota bacterium]
MIRVLMVCTGNICRSPTAEGVFRKMVEERGVQDRFQIDSAGMIAYHVGESPDSRSTRTALAHDIDIRAQRARQVTRDDFDKFDYLLAMDNGHLSDLQAMAPAEAQSKIALFLSYLDGGGDVPDPYYGGASGFEKTFQLIERGSAAFLDHLDTKGLI